MSATTVLAASPEQLRAAASRLSNVAAGLDAQSSSIEGAAGVATGAWSGVASTMFSDHCDRLCNDARSGSSALRRAGDALQSLAGELEYAQTLARESLSLAASADSLRAQVVTMEPSPMIRVVTEEAYAASSRAGALEAEADRIAREAGARAAAVLRDVEGAAPSKRDLAWGGVRRLSPSDLAAYMRMEVSGLPDRVQEAAGRRLAQLLLTATEGDDWDSEEVGALIDLLADNGYDGDLAAGFFNRLTGSGTADLIIQLQIRYGAFSEESERFSTPLSIALGQATRSGRLDEAFVEGVVEREYVDGSSIHVMAQLVEHGIYESGFILRFGERVVQSIAHDRTSIGSQIPREFLDARDLILQAVARTPEAARDLLLMDLDEPSYVLGYESAMEILLSGDYYGPETGLGALITAATIESRGEAPLEANQVVLRLIQHTPEIHEKYGLGTHTVQAVADVAAAWWEDIAKIAYAGYANEPWAMGSVFTGSATADGVRVPFFDAVDFLRVGISDPDGRATIMGAMNRHSEELIARIVQMPANDRSDNLLLQLGAHVEMFSIADSIEREMVGKQIDEFNSEMRQLTGLLVGEAMNPAGKLAKPLSLVAGQFLDELFESQEQLLGVKSGALQDLKLRTQLNLAVIAEAQEMGRLPQHERNALVRLILMGDRSQLDGIRFMVEPLMLPRLAMDQLREDYLERYMDAN